MWATKVSACFKVASISSGILWQMGLSAIPRYLYHTFERLNSCFTFSHRLSLTAIWFQAHIFSCLNPSFFITGQQSRSLSSLLRVAFSLSESLRCSFLSVLSLSRSQKLDAFFFPSPQLVFFPPTAFPPQSFVFDVLMFWQPSL